MKREDEVKRRIIEASLRRLGLACSEENILKVDQQVGNVLLERHKVFKERS